MIASRRPAGSREFGDRGAPRIRLSIFLNAMVAAGEVGRQLGARWRPAFGRVEFPRAAVQRGVRRQLARDGPVPERRHRSGQPDELGRGVERAGQVVGQESQRGHRAAKLTSALYGGRRVRQTEFA